MKKIEKEFEDLFSPVNHCPECKGCFDVITDTNGKLWQWIEDKLKQARVDELNNAIADLPTTWLDPRLTGEDKIVGETPFSCLDIERLFLEIKQRFENRIKQLNE